MKPGVKKQVVFILHVTSLSTFHGQCIYGVGGDGNHCSCWQQTCWVNIDTRQCRNPTRDPKSMPSGSVFSYLRPYPHFKPSGTGTPPVHSLEAEKLKFYCRPPDFWSQLTNYSFPCLIFWLINVPVNFPWLIKINLIQIEKHPSDGCRSNGCLESQMWWESWARPLGEGGQVLTLVQLPLRPGLPLIGLVCVPTSS